MSIYDTISSRHSVRAYTDEKIPRDTLERILRAGTQAPTARNEQSHRTIAVTDPELIAKLVPNQPFTAAAPCILVVYAEGGDRIMSCGHSARTVDCSICLSYMVLCAAEEGLQGCWLGAFDSGRVVELLGLPPTSSVVALHTLGYPQPNTPRRDKKPPETLYEIR